MKSKKRYSRISKIEECTEPTTEEESSSTPENEEDLSTTPTSGSIGSTSSTTGGLYICSGQEFNFEKKILECSQQVEPTKIGRTIQRDVPNGKEITIDCKTGCIEIVKVKILFTLTIF